MPLLGILHMMIAIGLAVHAMRTGRPQYWLFILLFVPALGSIAYVVFELLPELARSRRAQKVTNDIGDIVDPDRESTFMKTRRKACSPMIHHSYSGSPARNSARATARPRKLRSTAFARLIRSLRTRKRICSMPEPLRHKGGSPRLRRSMRNCVSTIRVSRREPAMAFCCSAAESRTRLASCSRMLSRRRAPAV